MFVVLFSDVFISVSNWSPLPSAKRDTGVCDAWGTRALDVAHDADLESVSVPGAESIVGDDMMDHAMAYQPQPLTISHH